MQTILLDLARWGPLVDSNGNIAVASDPYSLSQDVASACKTWLGEYFFDVTLGVPYPQILGQTPSATFIQAQLVQAALTVPGVNNPVAYLTGFSNRQLSGQVQFEDDNGVSQTASF